LKRDISIKSAIRKGDRQKGGLLSAVLFTTLIGSMFNISAFAQNPCSERGPDCRVLTPAEVKAFRELVLAVSTLLPVPEATRYVPNGAIKASTMQFVAETKISGAIHIGVFWQTGCFPIYPNNSLLFGYDAKVTLGKPVDKD